VGHRGMGEAMAHGERRDLDVVVVGGGHNGLTAAAYLARAGKRVLVLERRHLVGGAAVTEELYPGYKYSVASYVVSLLRPEIIRELELPRHGLEILPLESTFTPLPGGDYLVRWAAWGCTCAGWARSTSTPWSSC
jgi:phytoene dehydrogenase-like protein